MTNRQRYNRSTPSVNNPVLRGCLLLFMGFVAMTAQAKTIFVKANATGTNNGTSWANAYTDLQLGLSNAVSGDEIWVAKGTYKPSPSNVQDQNAAFVMLPNVKIYGSFEGIEANLAARTPSVRAANVSILSGDLGSNDDLNGNLNANTFNFDNSYNVISNIDNGLTNANALLDGFTVSGGNTQDVSAGGGMLNVRSSPSVVNVTFTRNYGRSGGGMFNNAAATSLSNVTFSGNSAGLVGGGMSNIGAATPSLNNVTFTNNQASYGGGMYNDNASPSLSRVIFSRNKAGSGGGMYNGNASSPSISNTIFLFNGTNSGDNTQYGGGMYNTSGATPSLNNVTFWKNASTNGGGGMYNLSSAPTIKNSIFWGNFNKIDPYSFSTKSSIEGDLANVTYSDIEQTSGVYAGVGNINEFPMFINIAKPEGFDNILGTVDDGLALTPCSPALNTGDNTGVATTDMLGNPRIFSTTVDMGAYEYQANPAVAGNRLYVNQAMANSGDGFSWQTAFKDLPSALVFATTCTRATEIWVAKGTYKPTASTTDRAAHFRMIGNVKIYGSFEGMEANLADRTPSVRAANPTILSGDLLGNDVITGSGSTLSITGNAENSYHVFANSQRDLNPLNNNSLLDGFIITGGNTQGEVNGNIYYPGSGGGMYIESYNNSPTIVNLSNLTFVGNNARSMGGGIFCNTNISLIPNNVTFSKNNANADGGGLRLNTNGYQPSINMKNAVFTDNNAAGNGGGMSMGSLLSASLNNVTFWGNNAGSGGGGLNGSSSNIKNSIFWGNTTGGTTVSSIVGSNNVVTNSDVEGGYLGTGNINQDPLFVNTANPAGADGIFGTADDGLALTACSSAVNAGDNTGVVATDITSNARIFGGFVDMGAYEFQSSTSSPLTIGAYPTATIRQCVVTAQTFTASATGLGTITVQWQRKQTTDLDYVNIGTSAAYTSGTNATYTTAPLSNADFGVMFRAVFSNSSCTAQTTPVTIYVVVPPQTTTNNALNFDGVNDCVQIYKCSGNLFAGGDAITIEYWFKGSSNQSAVRMQDNGEFIIAGWNGTHILSNDGGLTGISVGTGYTDGNWHHIAMTWQRGGLFTSYLDGVQVAQRAASTNPLPSFSAGVYLGSLGGTSEFMTGSLDDVRVWTVARTQVQIQANMSACTLSDQTNLLMYYPFNHGTANGANATINTLRNTVNASELTGTLNGFDLSTNSNWTTGKSCAAVLSVELLDFKGTPQYNGNFLTWTTANEVNNKGFNVERLMDNGEWLILDFVKAQGKAATYDFMDNQPFTTSYYRLRQIDNDGKEMLSKIISVVRVDTHGRVHLHVYPNPAHNSFTIDYAVDVQKEVVEYSVTSMLGQTLLQGKLTSNSLDISSLPMGAFVFKIGEAKVRFVKQ